MSEIALGYEKEKFIFVLCGDTQDGKSFLHIVPLQDLGVGPCFSGEDDEEYPIYVLIVYITTGQDPLSIKVEIPWILVPSDNI